jgi:hypothetical protein
VDRADALALDPDGNTYLGGLSSSLDFPLLRPFPGQGVLHGPYDGFLTKISRGGTALLYSSYLGGTNADEVQGIATDQAGFVYATGFTTSTNFPITPGAFSPRLNGNPDLTPLFDGFVTKINPLGTEFVYSTFLGGSNTDSGFRIAVDALGNAFITGATTSPEFPNTATNLGLGLGFTNAGFIYEDVFITRLAPQGALDWSVRFGGGFVDVGWDIALDGDGNPYVISSSSSFDFPITNNAGFTRPLKATFMDKTVFITAIERDAAAVFYSLPLGGRGDDGGYGIAVDPAGNAYVVGKTTSTNFPSVTPLQTELLGASDTFLAKISREPVLETVLNADHMILQWRAFSPEFRLEFSTNSAPSSPWLPVPGVPETLNGWHSQRVGLTNQGGFFRLRRQ